MKLLSKSSIRASTLSLDKFSIKCKSNPDLYNGYYYPYGGGINYGTTESQLSLCGIKSSRKIDAICFFVFFLIYMGFVFYTKYWDYT